jgi:hypothetical protein
LHYFNNDLTGLSSENQRAIAQSEQPQRKGQNEKSHTSKGIWAKGRQKEARNHETPGLIPGLPPKMVAVL